MHTLYTLVSKTQWTRMQSNRFLSYKCEDYDFYDEPMDNWMMQQMKKRLPDSAFDKNNPEANGAHFMFLNRADIYSPYSDGMVLLEVEVLKEHLIYFGDNDYVMVVNNICNGWKLDFLASSQSEADEMKNASEDVIVDSWERMFDITRDREIEYAGELELRAMTPCITTDMVKSVTIM